MLPLKLRAKLGADEIREVMRDKPRRWNRDRAILNLMAVAIVALLFWMAYTDLVGAAIDHELDMMERPALQAPATLEEVRAIADSVPADTEDYTLLAQLIHAEARGESFEGQVAVGSVVLNRVNDPRWPDTVEAVVMEPGQFASPTEATEETQRAAQEALQGYDPTGGATYFYNPEVSRCGWIVTREEVMSIGSHVFLR